MRRVKRIFAVLFLFFLIGFVAVGSMFVVEMGRAKELLGSLPDKLKQYSTKPSRILSADGKVLFTIQSEYRRPVTYSEIPKVVRDAILAAEDKRFYEHSGVDYWAMGRIVLVGAKEGRLSQGGSTLTMQLAKRFYSEGQKTLDRKLQDVALAITMERDMTKDQILTLYMNTMYFGEKAYGIQAAADVYFGKTIDKLTVAEAAMLARCVRRPSDENPVKNMDKAVSNRNVVLGIMRDEKMITDTQYDEAISEPVKLAPRRTRITSRLNLAPYFVAHVLQFLDQDLPDIDIKQGGYTVYTTIDTKMEAYAEKQVRAFVREHRDGLVNQAAFVLMDKNGNILAEVGGLDFNKEQFNIVTQGSLQPGSSFKPILYSAAFALGQLSPSDRFENRTYTYPGTENWRHPWVVHNSSPREDSDSAGIESAIAYSYNVVAAHVMERVTPSAAAQFARGTFGIRVPHEQEVPSMALGSLQVSPLEMLEAYSVFMMHGTRVKPRCVTKIVGPDDQVVRSYEPQLIPDQLDAQVASEIDHLLWGVVNMRGATGSSVGDVPNARGKTGTTSDHKDIWFCGYTDGLVGVGWAGNNVIKNGRVYQLPMGQRMWGATAASGLWESIMLKAHERFASPIPDLPKPSEDPFRGPSNDQPDSVVKVVPPGETDGTTGGAGTPVVVPPPGTSNIGDGTTGGDAPPSGTTPPVNTPPGQDPANPTPPKRDPPRRRPDPESDTVQVEVCAESGMRATIYCPETVTRTFKRGQEPKKRCTIHGG